MNYLVTCLKYAAHELFSYMPKYAGHELLSYMHKYAGHELFSYMPKVPCSWTI